MLEFWDQNREIINYVLFVPGFILLIKGADWMVEGATSIARKLHVSDLVIGLTIVSFGTSAPELAVNLIASFQGQADLAIANVLGSNIANILLILGVTAMITEIRVGSSTTWKEIPLSVLAAIMIGIMANDVFFDGSDKNLLSRSDGLSLIGFFIIFLAYTFGLAQQGDGLDEIPEGDHSWGVAVVLTLVGLVMLPIGADWIVDGAVQMALAIGISELYVGLTIVAIGTSLPELAASVVAARKGSADLAIGNAVGSNLFNIFWILGVSSTILPIPFSDDSNIDMAMTVFASLLLFGLIFLGRRHVLGRTAGTIFLLTYVVYMAGRAFMA